jgi:RsiW-degrading membrane proteinase PrsW (M82 family)
MLNNPIFLLGISTIIAAIPAGIWLYILFNKANKSKKVITLVFLLGCLTAPALLGLQYIWDIFPQFNLSTFIQENITSQSKMYIAMFVLFGALEEIIKLYVITTVDKKTVLIKTIGDSIRYSVAAALGFSFTENIYYLYEFWPSISTGELVNMYIFRSVFTACAHMIFSGIFGYFYGIGKFSIEIVKQHKLTGKISKSAKFIGKIFNLSLSHAYQQQMVFKGLIIAVLMHATYNYLLQFNIIWPVMIFVILGYLYLRYLLSRKAGHLILTTDISTKSKSTLAKKDEDVVIELIGMWFKEKKYVDVIHICERLLERDPDNKVVKIFKAKAMDKMDDRDTYKSILGTILKTSDDLSVNDRNIISKYTEGKEMFNKVKRMIKKQLEKEGKAYKGPQKEPQKKSPPKKKTGTTEDYTGEGTFKIGE